jgi:3-methyladenine DNA glycosylase AlkD
MKKAKGDLSLEEQVQWVLEWLKAHATKASLDGMARYAIPSDKAFGVAMKDMKALGKQLGRNHELALALWETGWYEARMLTAFVADPAALTAAQMDRWCKELDNWAYCDHLSFHLFDRTPHAWAKVEQWSRRKGEFERRAAFALLWSLALHDKRAKDQQFVDALGLIERAADDDRNFVKKAVSMALRAIGTRNASLRSAAGAAAARLAKSPRPSARWIGKDASRKLAAEASKRAARR